MFERICSHITVRTVNAPKRGLCLEALAANGAHIYMDFCGMNPALVPDGTNAYFFGNTLLVVTRWSDMTDAEKETVQTAPLVLAIHPVECTQLSLGIGGKWSDVMVTLHHCYEALNEEPAPVDEVVFLFADTHDSDYLTARTVRLPPFLRKALQKGNIGSHAFLSFDGQIAALENAARNDPYRDFFDYLYDLNWEKTAAISRKARSYEPEDIPDGIYLEIGSDNTVTNLYQNEQKPSEPPMSDEVKTYLRVAEMGVAEAQYNLGVCYERGDGVAQDYEKAVYWYKKAVDQGHAKAQHNLGLCYYNGIGVPVDQTEAARLFLLSAEQGDMYAQFNMGVAYYNGEGVEQNILRATEWLLKAAEQGHPDARRFFES